MKIRNVTRFTTIKTVTYLKMQLALILMLIGSAAAGQGISGRVTDASTGLSLPGAGISVDGTTSGTVTDENGLFLLNLPKGTYQLNISFLGYQTIPFQITVTEAVREVNFGLKPAGNALNQLTITGSRSAQPRTNIESPVPIDVISSREMRNYAQTDVTQSLNYIAPSFSSNRQAIADGTDHIDPASLRGLGPDQVLVLVNGKRRHNTALVNINGTFGRGTVGTDMNAIPMSAIDHIEVLRDGAAAQYGSDAIAGVINIVLKKVSPLMMSGTYGQSATTSNGVKYNDGKTYEFDVSKGWNLKGKGFLNLSGRYMDRGATNRGGIDSHPLLYSALPSKGANETEDAFQNRFAAIKTADDARANAAGISRDNMAVGNSHSRNLGGFFSGQYKIASWAEAYLAVGISRKTGVAAGFVRLPNQFTQIDTTKYPNGFLPQIKTTIDDASASGGVKGKIANWNYDISHTFGRNSIAFEVDHSLNASLPIGTSPESFKAGKLIFSQNTTNFDITRRLTFSGLVKSIGMSYGVEHRVDHYEIQPGEELSYSFGQPSRDIPGRLVGTTPAAAGSQVFPGFKPNNAVNKSRNNNNIYADYEAEIGTGLLLGAAGRYEYFSDFGSNFSYKFSGRAKLAKSFSVRAAIATGFRAPSLAQRFLNNESTQFVSGNPTQVLTVNNDSPIVSLFGVGPLKPELSKSSSVGITGTILSGLTYTVDAYQIDIHNRIVFSSQFTRATAGVADILNTIDPKGTINSVQFFTNAISTRTKGLDIVLAKKIELDQDQSLTFSAAGNMNRTKVRTIQGSDVIEGSASLKGKLFDRTERSRFESSVPRGKANLSAAYENKKLVVSLRTVYFGKVTFLNAVDPTIPANNLPLQMDQTYAGKWITDLSVTYRFVPRFEVNVGVNNLFDIYPDKNYIDPRNNQHNLSGDPKTNYTTGRDNTFNGHFVYSRALTQFGFNGRFVSTRVTYKF